jgi:hypothetical protein
MPAMALSFEEPFSCLRRNAPKNGVGRLQDVLDSRSDQPIHLGMIKKESFFK